MVKVFLCLLLATVACPACAATKRLGKRTPGLRFDKAVVLVEGTRRMSGIGGDTGYDVRVVRVDGKPARGSRLQLDPGPHAIQLEWSRIEMPDAYVQGLNRDVEPSTRWVKTAGGCCTVDVDVRGGRAYTLVWDPGPRHGKCPFRVRELPQCP